MYEEYIKENKILEKTDKERDMELMKSVIKTKIDLENDNKNFEFADGDLVDYYIYRIKANQAKLDYLLKKVKKKGIMLDMVNEKDIRLYIQDEVS